MIGSIDLSILRNYILVVFRRSFAQDGRKSHRQNGSIQAELRGMESFAPEQARREHLLQASVDPVGNRTSYGYDAIGRPVSTTNPLNFINTIVYDADSRVIATVDPLGNRTSFGFDAAGRPVSTTNPLGFISTSVFDAASRLVARVDALWQCEHNGF